MKSFLDKSTQGVIYVSYGSMVRADTLPEEKRVALLQAFAKFKQKVLWKYENDTMPDKPFNVFIRKWMPQRDVLCKAYLSHLVVQFPFTDSLHFYLR